MCLGDGLLSLSTCIPSCYYISSICYSNHCLSNGVENVEEGPTFGVNINNRWGGPLEVNVSRALMLNNEVTFCSMKLDITKIFWREHIRRFLIVVNTGKLIMHHVMTVPLAQTPDLCYFNLEDLEGAMVNNFGCIWLIICNLQYKN